MINLRIGSLKEKFKFLVAKDIHVFLLFLILPVIFFWKLFFLPFDDRLYIQGDFSVYFSSFYYLTDRLAQGEFPLWDPYVYQGLPQIARADTALFYPINLAWAVIGTALKMEDYPLYIWYELQPIMHLALTGIGTYLLCRYLKLSKEGSFMSGLVFMFSPILQSMVNTVPLISSLAWLPLITLSFLKSLDNVRPTILNKNVVITTLLMGLSHYAGYFQHSFFYNSMVLVGFLLFKIIHNQVKNPKVIAKKVFQLAIPMAVSVCIYAAQLIPTLELVPRSDRGSISYNTASLTGSLQPLDLVNIIIPNLFLYPINGDLVSLRYPFTYFGILTLLFAIVALISSNKYKILLGTLFILFVVASLGASTSLYEFIYLLVPGMDKFRNVHKLIYPAAFALSILSGVGLDTLLNQTHKDILQKRAKYFLLPLVLIPLLILNKDFLFIDYYQTYVQSLSFSPEPTKELAINAVFLFTVFFGISFIVFRSLIAAKSRILVLAAIVVIFVDLANAAKLIHANNTRTNPYYFFFSKDKVGFREPINKDEDIFRVYIKEFTTSAHYTPEIFKAMNVSGYSAFALSNVTNEKSYFVQAGANTTSTDFSASLTKMGVKYLITTEDNIQDKKLVKILEDVVTKENHKFYFKYGGDYAGWVNRPIGDKIYVFENKAFTGLADLQGTYSFSHFSPEKITIQTETSVSNAKLLLRIPFYPGWKAKIGRTAVPVSEDESGYINVKVPTGSNTIQVYFSPDSFYLGVVLSTISLVLCIYFYIRLRNE